MKIDITRLRLIFLLGIIILLAQSISSTCDENQVDINEASVDELDKLNGVGPVIAQNIIDARPYKTLDDLMDASGIGEAKLEGIKSQGLACIEDKDGKDLDDENESNDNEGIINEISDNSTIREASKIKTPIVLELIKIDAKTIKSEKNNDISSNRYAIYGLIGFGILLSLLLFFRSKKYKTEFK